MTNEKRALACFILPVLRMLYSSDGMTTIRFFPDEKLSDLLIIEPDADIASEFAAYLTKNGCKPEDIFVRGLGSFKIDGSDKQTGNSKKTGSDKQTGNGRLFGKIAIVTGGAQGFGKGIAEAMAAEGAYITVADMNFEGASTCAAMLNEQYGDNTAIAIEVDVSNAESVERMVQDTVLTFGGLDILVSNAGILIAGNLDDLSKESFELVTKVNYTGYFLCAKYAAVPMKLQSSISPGYMMDIIEINSKSGLEGSNKNFAYAGSKFGGIGLTQSFAMELVEYGIKVNAICPGNFLDGPLWSDPKRGLFKQYLDSGKVAGAKTTRDVREFYEKKVPLGRGCTIADVVCALLYVIEQKYETGQAIPVTGGQVMLR
ncbi:MAG: SDR family NAD(P)-dependent oxidoreductase [Oscillospiraceae bacterium]|jgi:sorbitol-6-phosphate 2-dehydrogenase|nr:SDR family NAD(P)-dependent oxidoreductase [Oscillospiraceae bacterium]